MHEEPEKDNPLKINALVHASGIAHCGRPEHGM